eukprot:CAMPEP_0204542872 /NCGR_PEP_ID=MMETSP0661-20131031/19315_1 /ASSEMBLY_ACC=CAM_ASM_000606 /TAXON_ID=109239 /ORGANISM="Alexandrium margalefi, Strain AMGDE01CS-322" /LENGTH=60 /DNA_ID=CAMNT_0051549593 /DNA_START=9 /DNA_END=188 /DNA_ORIENTATION=+
MSQAMQDSLQYTMKELLRELQGGGYNGEEMMPISSGDHFETELPDRAQELPTPSDDGASG